MAAVGDELLKKKKQKKTAYRKSKADAYTNSQKLKQNTQYLHSLSIDKNLEFIGEGG